MVKRNISLHGSKKSVFSFFPTPRFLAMSPVGIDISDNSIKFVELKDTKDGRVLGKFGREIIPAGVVEKGEIQDSEKLAQVLKLMKQKYKLDFVRVSLPEEKVYLFQMQVPNTANEKEIRGILEFKLEEHVPISSKESIFDYEFVSGSEKKETIGVSVAVYPKTVIEKYAGVFRKARLTPLSFETEAQAVERAVVRDGDDGTYMVIDFGRTRTGLSITSNGMLSLTSTLEVDGQSITDVIVKHLSVSEEEADRVKNESGLIKSKGNKEFAVAMTKVIDALNDEIKKYVDYWHSRSNASGTEVKKIEKIILCGGSANIAGLSEYISGSLKIPTEIANVWVNAFSIETVVPEMNRYQSLAYATAIGLALRR